MPRDGDRGAAPEARMSAALRDVVADAIEREWLARAASGAVGSPREHAEALADAVIEDVGQELGGEQTHPPRE